MSDELIICGVDPGEHTGLFVVRIRPERVPVCRIWRAEVSQHEVAPALENQLEMEPRTVVACERYVITQKTIRTTRQPAAMEVIGNVKDVCHRYDARLRMQMKSDVAKTADNSTLREIGWYARGMRHANDGARHALYALQYEKASVFMAIFSRGTLVV